MQNYTNNVYKYRQKIADMLNFKIIAKLNTYAKKLYTRMAE